MVSIICALRSKSHHKHRIHNNKNVTFRNGNVGKTSSRGVVDTCFSINKPRNILWVYVYVGFVLLAWYLSSSSSSHFCRSTSDVKSGTHLSINLSRAYLVVYTFLIYEKMCFSKLKTLRLLKSFTIEKTAGTVNIITGVNVCIHMYPRRGELAPLISKSEKCCECAHLYVCNRVTD